MRPTLFAIDPGDRHQGTAYYEDGQVSWTKTMTRDELTDYLLNRVVRPGEIFEVVLEEFRLYPWKSDAQAFSQMLTVEVIGVVKFICDQRGWPLTMARTGSKKPTFAIMKKRGVALVGKGQHEKDAEAHGYYRTQQRLRGRST